MARFDFTILSRCTPGEEEEFENWYTTQHLEDVCRIDGVESARLTKIKFQKVYDLDAPDWGYMALYVLDVDDPQVVLDRIAELRDTEAMPLSTALNREGMVQTIGETVGTYP